MMKIYKCVVVSTDKPLIKPMSDFTQYIKYDK